MNQVVKRWRGSFHYELYAMNHKLAEETNAVGKYLLDELTEAERIDFEEHLFDCTVCADSVRNDAIIVDNLKDVLLESRPLKNSSRLAPSGFNSSWWRPMVLLPTFAALALAVLTSYQNIVLIPALYAPRVLQTHIIDSAARGLGTPVVVNPNAPMFNLSFDVDSPQAYASYVCEFQNERKETVLTVDAGNPKVAAFTLSLLLPTKKFPSGQYAATVSAGANRTEVFRLPFVIQK